MFKIITLIVALYGAILSTIQWVMKRRKKLEITCRVENTAFEGDIIDTSFIFQIINLSNKPIFIKYCYLLDDEGERLLISPDMFWSTKGELDPEEVGRLNPDRMLEVVFNFEKVEQEGAQTFVLEDETGRKFSLNFNSENQSPETYNVVKQ